MTPKLPHAEHAAEVTDRSQTHYESLALTKTGGDETKRSAFLRRLRALIDAGCDGLALSSSPHPYLLSPVSLARVEGSR